MARARKSLAPRDKPGSAAKPTKATEAPRRGAMTEGKAMDREKVKALAGLAVFPLVVVATMAVANHRGNIDRVEAARKAELSAELDRNLARDRAAMEEARAQAEAARVEAQKAKDQARAERKETAAKEEREQEAAAPAREEAAPRESAERAEGMHRVAEAVRCWQDPTYHSLKYGQCPQSRAQAARLVRASVAMVSSDAVERNLRMQAMTRSESWHRRGLELGDYVTEIGGRHVGRIEAIHHSTVAKVRDMRSELATTAAGGGAALSLGKAPGGFGAMGGARAT
jgi:hypothetical protein